MLPDSSAQVMLSAQLVPYTSLYVVTGRVCDEDSLHLQQLAQQRKLFGTAVLHA